MGKKVSLVTSFSRALIFMDGQCMLIYELKLFMQFMPYNNRHITMFLYNFYAFKLFIKLLQAKCSKSD